MKYIKTEDLKDFDFFMTAEDNARRLTLEELEKVENNFKHFFTETPYWDEVNNLFWDYFDEVCDFLGLDVEEVEARPFQW